MQISKYLWVAEQTPFASVLWSDRYHMFQFLFSIHDKLLRWTQHDIWFGIFIIDLFMNNKIKSVWREMRNKFVHRIHLTLLLSPVCFFLQINKYMYTLPYIEEIHSKIQFIQSNHEQWKSLPFCTVSNETNTMLT